MILVGSQRGGASNLAAHLMNLKDNDHVTVQELRGFVAENLKGALTEASAISKGTKCKQFLFSLSLNPPKDADQSIEDLIRAVDRAEEKLGLTGQPRALIIHEKNGRRHAHAVWSRIDPAQMKAINLPHFKTKLNELSKELFLENSWELPDGYKTNGWKNPLNFSLAEWQQAKRLDLDPREIKQVFQNAWAQSDEAKSFRNALEEHGYYLAKGDRRGVVAVDLQGEVFSVARWANVKTKELNARFGIESGRRKDRDQAPEQQVDLPGVAEVQQTLKTRLSSKLRQHMKDTRKEQAEELKPLVDARNERVLDQREERKDFEEKIRRRWTEETKIRASRLRHGFRGVLDILTGRASIIKRNNEKEAYQCHLRDKAQREDLFDAQMKERRDLDAPIQELRQQHRTDRMNLARRIAQVLKLRPPKYRTPEQQQEQDPHAQTNRCAPGLDFDR